MQQSVAILVFAQSPEKEALRKKIVRGSYGANKAALRVMMGKTARLVSQTRLPAFFAAGLPIPLNGDFAEQLSACLVYLFGRGYDNLICIGNDCPMLSIRDIRRAGDALALGQHCIGPDQRGGVYLFTMSRGHYAQTLQELPWQTGDLADNLRGFYRSNGLPLAVLPVKSDINSAAELKAFLLNRSCRIKWMLRLNNIVQTVCRLIHVSNTGLLPAQILVASCLTRRGPPPGADTAE